MTRQMKDSGVEWIGEIPEDWEVYKLKHLGFFSASGIDKKIKKDESKIKIVNYVDIYHSREKLIRNSDYMEVTASRQKIEENNLVKGDALFTPSSETIEEIGYSAIVDENLLDTSYSYHLLRFRFTNTIEHNYKRFMFNNIALLNQFASEARGTTRKTLNRIDFEEAKIPLPPRIEQSTIAYFLDKKTKEIDTIIAESKQAIEEYKKYKQALITEKVTKGLDKSASMKDSGMEWVGKIPNSWDIVKLKNIVKLSDGTHDSPLYVDQDENTFPLVTSRCIKNGIIDTSLANHISYEDHYKISKRSGVDLFDVIMPMIGTVGNPAIIKTKEEFSIKNVALFKTKGNLNLAKYIKYLIDSNVVKTQFNLINMGGVQNFASQSEINNLKIPFSKYDYTEIVSYLDQKCNKVDQVILMKEKLVEEMEAYKKSLIFETVTGKREVD